MLLHDLTHIDVPITTARERILGPDGNGWMTLVSRADGGVDGVGRIRLGVRGDRSLLTKTLQIQLGPPVARAADVIVEFKASPVSLQSLFPRVIGAIELNPAGASGTLLTVYGRYRPPLGVVGRIVDRSLAQRVAQGALHRLLQEVATRLSADSGKSPISPARLRGRPPQGRVALWRRNDS